MNSIKNNSSMSYLEEVIFRAESKFSERSHCYRLGKVCPSLIPNSLSSSTVTFIQFNCANTSIKPLKTNNYSGFSSILLYPDRTHQLEYISIIFQITETSKTADGVQQYSQYNVRAILFCALVSF